MKIVQITYVLFSIQIRDSIADGSNIFALSQLIVHGTPCRVTVQLCSRVALMVRVSSILCTKLISKVPKLCQRAIHEECSGHEKYWNMIDARLCMIRRVAGSDKAKVTRCLSLLLVVSLKFPEVTSYLCRAFKNILNKDRATYGVGEDYQIGDVVGNEWQQRVDDVVAGIPVEQQGT